jgi:hypothetical protein
MSTEDGPQVTAAQLAAMTADEIVQAQDRGRLDRLLGRQAANGPD